MTRQAKLPHCFDEHSFAISCNKLAAIDPVFKNILDQYGLPPMWTRPARFSTLVLTILEQQVSLAAAMAAYRKLKNEIRWITPERILAMSDESLRACYFSRQKIQYVRILAYAIKSGELNLRSLHTCSDEEVHRRLTVYKGIGDWTADIYMIHALRRADRFPLGDIALVNSMKESLQLGKEVERDFLLQRAEHWRPYRTIAAMMFWHAYISKRKLIVEL